MPENLKIWKQQVIKKLSSDDYQDYNYKTYDEHDSDNDDYNDDTKKYTKDSFLIHRISNIVCQGKKGKITIECDINGSPIDFIVFI